MASRRTENTVDSEISECDYDTDIKASGQPPTKKRRKSYKQKYNQKYNHSWEKEPQLKGWLTSVREDPYKAKCKPCGKELVAGLTELKRHALSKKHQESVSATKARPIT